MQLATIRHNDEDRVGVRRSGDEIVLLELTSMRDLIGLGPEGTNRVLAALERGGAIVDLQDVAEWLPPVPDPGKVLGVAMNNSASNERKISAPDHPAYFLKPSSCLIGHNSAVRIRKYYGSVHPEPELAVVIGKLTRDVDADSAMDRVYGFTIFNDITGNGMRADDLLHYWALYAADGAADTIERHEQHLSYAARYKGTDTFGCMGPWLTTADEVPDPDDLDIFCSVGGESVAEDSTRYYNYKVAEIVSYISYFQTLHPGDVISCGTAVRPSPGRRSIHQANLQNALGPIEVRIDGLGTLINPVTVDDTPFGRWRLSRSNAMDLES